DRLLRHHRPDLGVRGRHLAGPAAGRDRPGPPGLAAGPPVAAAGAGLGGPGGAGLHRCAAGGPGHVPGLDRSGPADGGGPGVPGRVDGLRPGRRPAAVLAALRLPREISYGLYLVHWPLLVIVLLVTGQESAGFVEGTVLIALSIVLAHLLT